jgi:hypothetical protein
VFDIEQIRRRQEQRLARSLESWNEAKKQLESAIALAEAREREFREVSDDVRRRGVRHGSGGISGSFFCGHNPYVLIR